MLEIKWEECSFGAIGNSGKRFSALMKPLFVSPRMIPEALHLAHIFSHEVHIVVVKEYFHRKYLVRIKWEAAT